MTLDKETQESVHTSLSDFMSKAKGCCNRRNVEYPSGTKNCYCLPCHITSAFMSFKQHIRQLNAEKKLDK